MIKNAIIELYSQTTVKCCKIDIGFNMLIAKSVLFLIDFQEENGRFGIKITNSSAVLQVTNHIKIM